MRISDWSSDVCSSDLDRDGHRYRRGEPKSDRRRSNHRKDFSEKRLQPEITVGDASECSIFGGVDLKLLGKLRPCCRWPNRCGYPARPFRRATLLSSRRYRFRSEEHTSELQSLMRISYAVFCLKKKKNSTQINNDLTDTIA